jgi:hypothetical protein
MSNPFHASFGVSPPLQVGREDLLDDFAEALEGGPGAAGRATLYTGARGAGKTVMLNTVEDRARQRGWLTVSETATPGFVSRMTQQHLPRLLRDFDPKAVQRRMGGVGTPLDLGSLTWSTIEAHVVQAGLRNQLEMLTFLRRAERHTLGSVARADVERALREPIQTAGREVGEEALQIMVDGARGYPFLLQLVGTQVWRVNPSAPEITAADATLRAALPPRVPPPALSHRRLTGAVRLSRPSR